MKNGNVDLANLGPAVGGILKRLRTYSGIGFFLVVAALYGFILWRINVYSNTPAAQSEANAASQPHINPEIAQKMLDLQNNSVNVQTLFDEARQNPFQE
jgi:hypothetical protein